MDDSEGVNGMVRQHAEEITDSESRGEGVTRQAGGHESMILPGAPVDRAGLSMGTSYAHREVVTQRW